MDKQTELELIAHAQAGDESAMATLVEYHKGFAVPAASDQLRAVVVDRIKSTFKF